MNPYQPPAQENTPQAAGLPGDLAYPLHFTFKILALAPQIFLRNCRGEMLIYVKQKLFRFREAVSLFTDPTRSTPVADIKADRIIDFSARYQINDPSGRPMGSMKRQGMRSLWRAHYEIFSSDNQPCMDVREENVWAKMMDSLLGSIPFIGFLSSFFFHPRYLLSRNGQPVLRITKEPALWEGRFRLEKLAPIESEEEQLALMSLLMILLLERSRG
jgi:uncharacterized protein YxjI